MDDYATQEVTLTFNDSGRFEDRWVHLKANERSKCVFTKGIEEYLPSGAPWRGEVHSKKPTGVCKIKKRESYCFPIYG